MLKIISLAIGSLVGGFCRYGLSGGVYAAWGPRFPYGTLIVNLLGCFIIGVLHSLVETKTLLSPEARLLLMTGFCGAFTTFSTFMLETADLLKGGQSLLALLNVTGSVIGGFVVFRLGAWLAG